MPVNPTYPGVYIEEIPSGVRTIVGVATSLTAFVGSSQRGPANDPSKIENFGDFERMFGPIQVNDMMGYAVRQFFQNGGNEALIIRVAHTDAKTSQVDAGGLPLIASGPGVWGNSIRVRIDHDTKQDEDNIFNLFLQYRDDDAGIETRETFRNISTNKDHERYVRHVLEEMSELARLDVEKADRLPELPDENGPLPTTNPDVFAEANAAASVKMDGGDAGGQIDNSDLLGDEGKKTGIYALEKADLFNLLCLPSPSRKDDVTPNTYSSALEYCMRRRAMLLVDSPSEWGDIHVAEKGLASFKEPFGPNTRNAALFFPRIKAPDPQKKNLLAEFVPCGAIAGICARTDVQRGVWKSPAGLDASLVGVNELSVTMTDAENGRLNPLGINCLRTFHERGNVVWGSRTLDGDDRLASDWKYLAIRRFTLFLEESLYRGTQWVVFEPNDEPLWAQIRLNIGDFMHTLFRQGAFQGTSPNKAYFVKCDEETTPQEDRDRGIVNIHVGFAPLKPAEFVIIKIRQIAGHELES